MDKVLENITLRKCLRSLADMVLPRTCVVCGRDLTLEERHICLECVCDLPFTRFWEREHNPMADKYNERIAPHIPDAVEEAYAFAAALLYYSENSPYKRIPQALKYERNISQGRYFAAMLGEKLLQSSWAPTVDLVVPVPVHWKRRLKRGYNQAEIIASEVAHKLGAPFCAGCLSRTRFSVSQTSVSLEKKASNVEGAFVAVKTPPARHILLVDDTFTSGSTLAACHKALRDAYPTPGVRISVATLSYVGP